jgi:mannose-6-phosphate isomerase-like protein (cupin superfamily)
MSFILLSNLLKSVCRTAEAVEAPNLKGIVTDIEKDTKENKNFRKVLYTGRNSQLVLMALGAEEDIGEEVHDVDQFFRIDEGSGKVIINGKEQAIKDGSAFIVPAGAKHNVIASEKGLKLYSIYSPPHHRDGTLHKTKEEAVTDKEHFDGKTTEDVRAVCGQTEDSVELSKNDISLCRDFLVRITRVLEAVEQGKTVSGKDPIELIRTSGFSKEANRCYKRISPKWSGKSTYASSETV